MNQIFMIVLFAMMAQSPSAEESSKIQKNAESECMSGSENAMPIEKSLENLEKKLQLTEQQKPLWTTWSTQLLATHHTKDEFNRTAVERRKLPAPERQEKWMTSVETHVKAMRDSLPALKAFYGSLNDQQRATFDSEVPFKHHGSGMMSQRPSKER